MRKKLKFIIILVILLFSCQSEKNYTPHTVLIVLAHPDDEMIISGTLAKLADRGHDVHMVYVTSGDEGPDLTGRGLHGPELARERESECRNALTALGIAKLPRFLSFPDSYIAEHVDEIRDSLLVLFQQIRPELVITFGPDGITDDTDHRTIGAVADFVYAVTDCSKLLLHMAVSPESRLRFLSSALVDTGKIGLRVNVAGYSKQRAGAVSAHHTQFSSQFMYFWKMRVLYATEEEYVIISDRGATDIITQCFE